MEKTFLMIKPDAIQRNLIGEVISRIEKKGLMINALKLIYVTDEQAHKHYGIHDGKPFFNKLMTMIKSGPVVVMCISGNDAVKVTRMLAGATKPLDSLPGTIRGDLSCDACQNVVHTSDSIENAQYELSIYFTDDEILDYKKTMNPHVFFK